MDSVNFRLKILSDLALKTAMLTHGSGDIIIAYRGNIWRFNSENIYDALKEDEIEEISKSLGSGISSSEWETPDELTDEIRDNNRPDILVGRIDGDIYKTLYLTNYSGFTLDPKSSILIKKIVKELDLDNVVYSSQIDDHDFGVSKWEAKGQISDVMFHGTTTKYLGEILKTGIRAGRSQSNYEQIVHPNLIFFSSRFDEAQHHSVHTAQKVGGDPMVIELAVPDKNLLVPDYDVDAQSGETNIYDYISEETRNSSANYSSMTGSADALSREFGIYGYRGRISPKFISSYHILTNAEEMFSSDELWYQDARSFYEATPEEAGIYWDTKNDYGVGQYEEMEEYEEEDWASDASRTYKIAKLLKISEKMDADNVRPNDVITVFHGTTLADSYEMINGFDANRIRPRLYGGPKHAGIFVAPSEESAEKFASYGEIILEIDVRAKFLHGVDYSGNIGRKSDPHAHAVDWHKAEMKARIEWAEEAFPGSFRPRLSQTWTQSSEPQALLRGLVSPKQIKRIRYKKFKEDPVWYSRNDFLKLNLEVIPRKDQPYGSKRRFFDAEYDLSRPNYSDKDLEDMMAKTLDTSPEQAAKMISFYSQLGRENPDRSDMLLDIFERAGLGETASKAYSKRYSALKMLNKLVK